LQRLQTRSPDHSLLNGSRHFRHRRDFGSSSRRGVKPACKSSSICASIFFVSSKTGAWVSSDGWSWVQLSYPFDQETGERLYSDEIYSIQTDFDGYLWLGTGDGLAKTANEGLIEQVLSYDLKELPDTILYETDFVQFIGEVSGRLSVGGQQFFGEWPVIYQRVFWESWVFGQCFISVELVIYH